MNNEARIALEQRIVRKLIRMMKAAGWAIAKIDDGGEVFRNSTEAEALEIVFSVDESWITFSSGSAAHSVYLVLGNAEDVVCDYGFAEGDLDGFVAVKNQHSDWTNSIQV